VLATSGQRKLSVFSVWASFRPGTSTRTGQELKQGWDPWESPIAIWECSTVWRYCQYEWFECQIEIFKL